MPERGIRSFNNNGGWISFFFIIVTNLLLTLSGAGCLMNLIVYLIGKFNFSSVDAALVFSIVNGTSNLLPIVAAVMADSFFGCFVVASVSSFILLMGTILLTLTSLVDALRPDHSCLSLPCLASPTNPQLTILYSSLALLSIGWAGFKFIIATMGANQFDKPEHQTTFFNWFIFSQYVGYVVSLTAIIYVQDNLGWGLGFGLCAVLGLVGTVVLVSGNRFYHHVKPEGSPFMDLAQVVAATINKWRLPLSPNPEDYQYGEGALLSKRLRFFNCAALKTLPQSDAPSDDAPIWSLCTVQKVEDFKTVIQVFPIWSTAILLSTPLAVLSSTTVLQALVMDRHLGPHFKIPAGTVPVLVMISASIFVALLDRVFNPLWLKFKKPSPVNPLKRIGVGHVLTILGMVFSALVESKRLHSESRISVLWLFPQMIICGVGEAFHYPGQVALYYQECPASLKSSATSLIAVIIGISFYLSSAIIDVSRRLGWLKNDIDKGRLDLAYWMLAVMGGLNFGYFLICATKYRCRYLEEEEEYSLKKQEAQL